ncbi:unnamed protein product [Aphanomyces euteiches]
MARLVVTETIALEEALAANIELDAMFMDDLQLFDTKSAVVVNDLESVTSIHSPPAPLEAESGNDDTTQRKIVNASRKRQRDELEYLRSKVIELEGHLKVVQQVKSLEDSNVSTWQKRADQARIAKQMAVNENEKLKHELTARTNRLWQSVASDVQETT